VGPHFIIVDPSLGSGVGHHVIEAATPARVSITRIGRHLERFDAEPDVLSIWVRTAQLTEVCLDRRPFIGVEIKSLEIPCFEDLWRSVGTQTDDHKN
jgi:hypothetical protein